MRKKIVAGNWKMNLLPKPAKTLVEALRTYTWEEEVPENLKIIIAPPSVYLKKFVELTVKNDDIKIAAQNCHQAESGAYTGEVAANMLAALNVNYVILGHSERRAYFHETDALLKQKVDAVLANDMQVIFCCGESLEIREANNQNEFVAAQLKNALFHLSPEEFAKCVLAYEPIWAIGTGKTASPEQAQAMHQFIRNLVAEKYGNTIADNLTILYGGSCKPANAASIFVQPDVDGGLIGGASLKAETFIPIIEALKSN